jgi:C4-type Zn-finger protein
MLCPRCKTEMQLTHAVYAGGRDGSVVERTWRCAKCWFHETVAEQRKA